MKKNLFIAAMAATALIACKNEDNETEDEQSMVIFHGIMATGSIYMAMLLTNWGTVSGHKSDAQMWVSIVSQWISISIYVWSIVAPKICQSREF